MGEDKKLQEIIDALVSINIVELKNGNAILSFDKDGKLRRVKIEQVVYKK